MIPAARGALALVPVCEDVHEWCRSVVTTLRSPEDPELYVVARVEEQASEYLKHNMLSSCLMFMSILFPHQGMSPFSVADETLRVQMEFVYPSQLQLSWSRPPLPEAHTKMEPCMGLHAWLDQL